MGAYRGKFSFDTFTHYKPVLEKKSMIDLPLRYGPYPNSFNFNESNPSIGHVS